MLLFVYLLLFIQVRIVSENGYLSIGVPFNGEKVTQRLSLALVTRICCKIDSIGPRVERRNASEILSADTDSKRGNGEP